MRRLFRHGLLVAAGTLAIGCPQRSHPEIVQDTAALIPGARFDLIPDAAHIPCVETPQAHAAIITRFLKEIRHA